MAEFINEKRDKYPERRKGKIVGFSEFYDWLWGYLLGLSVNFIFLLIAYEIKNITKGHPLENFGLCLYIVYMGNMLFWFGGLIIDLFRILKYPGGKKAS